MHCDVTIRNVSPLHKVEGQRNKTSEGGGGSIAEGSNALNIYYSLHKVQDPRNITSGGSLYVSHHCTSLDTS